MCLKDHMKLLGVVFSGKPRQQKNFFPKRSLNNEALRSFWVKVIILQAV
jgi:hypothetical protein